MGGLTIGEGGSGKIHSVSNKMLRPHPPPVINNKRPEQTNKQKMFEGLKNCVKKGTVVNRLPSPLPMFTVSELLTTVLTSVLA